MALGTDWLSHRSLKPEYRVRISVALQISNGVIGMGVYFTLNNKSNLLDLPMGVNTVYWLAVKTNIWGYRIMVDYGALIRLRSWFDSTYPYQRCTVAR